MLRYAPVGAQALLMMRTWSYRDWSTALRNHYFSARSAGEPVLFLVDEDHLLEIHPSRSASEAAASLAEVVRGRMDFGHPNGEFHRVERDARRWRHGDSAAPDPLPLLALCVLAASWMGSGTVSTANYREHFCGLLDLPKTTLPPGYGLSVPQLWQYLHEWLEDLHGGSYGRSTIVKSAAQPWIGYALSQTLFLSADVARLADFFESIELAPGEDVDGPELLAYFRAWAPSHGLSKGARYMMDSDDHAPGLERILSGHARRWDGTRVPGSGERRSVIRVVVDPYPRLQVALAAPRGEGLPESPEVLAPDGRRVRMSSTSSHWYDSVPLPVEAGTLRHGASLQGAGFSLILRGGEVHVLRLDPQLGGWGSVPSVLVGERHWVLLADEVWERVRGWLFEHGGSECQEDERLARVLPRWHLVRDVVIERPPATPPPAGMACLSPSIQHRVALKGGLPLQRGGGAYLVGGPPDLWRPMIDEETIPARLVSNGQERDLPGEGLHLRLADLDPPLGHGEHVIQALGALRRSLTLVPSTRLKPPTVDRPEHRLAITTTGQVESHQPPGVGLATPEEVRVSGARVLGGAVAGVPPQPVLINRRARYAVVLGSRPGEREGVPSRPPAPSWMADLGLSDRFADFSPSFEPVWVIETWADAPRRRARAVSGQKPEAAVDDLDAVAAWAEELSEIDRVRARDEELWQQYVAVAEEIGT